MNRIDLTNLGGFPLEQDTLKFMQDGYGDMFSSIAAMFGDKRILSGVEVVGGNVTDGWITYGGEIIKFIGGAAGPEVVIQETTQDATFEDGNIRPVYKSRVATIGGPGGFPFSDLKPANLGVPVGTVLMWSGNVAAIPAGFALCDGQNGTPDLRGRMILGYDPADADYDALGKMGGAKKQTLQQSQLPSVLNVTVQGKMIRKGETANGVVVLDVANVNGAPADPYFGTKDCATQIKNLGGGQELDNRSPYYILAYIIKL